MSSGSGLEIGPLGQGETGDWPGALNRVKNLIMGHSDPLGGLLPQGWGTDHVVETWARELCAERGVDLGLVLPTALTCVSGATQGAFTAPLRVAKGVIKELPMVFQFIGIAPSGEQKSEILDALGVPLGRLLEYDGVEARRQWTITEKQKAIAASGFEGVTLEAQQALWDKIFAGALCPSSVTNSGTPEGIRTMMAANGSHRIVLTGEDDILREVSAYSKNGSGGSLSMFVTGWDQGTFSADRAGGVPKPAMPAMSLPFAVIIQPDPFNRHTAPDPKSAADDYMDKGIFSRAWLWKVESSPSPVDTNDVEDADYWGTPGEMVMTPFMLAEAQVISNLGALVARSNEYRARKALCASWLVNGAPDFMPTPEQPDRTMLALDDAGRDAYRKISKTYWVDLLAFLDELDAFEPGAAMVYRPLARRSVNHVMRIAGLLTLADDPDATVLSAQHMIDVATRILPWLWSGWMVVIRERFAATAVAAVSEQVLRNRGLQETGIDAALLRTLALLRATPGPIGVPTSARTWSMREIQRKGKSMVSALGRAGAGAIVKEALAEMAADGLVKIKEVQRPGAVKVMDVSYALTDAGFQQAVQAGYAKNTA